MDINTTDGEEFTIDHLSMSNPHEEVKPEPVSKKDMAFLQSENQGRFLRLGKGALNQDPENVKLYPFDTYRQVAAQKMGMEFFNMGEDAADQFQETNTYNGLFFDAILVSYLCVMPEKVAMKALSHPMAVKSNAMRWAASKGITVGSSNHAALCEAFGEIIGEILESYAQTAGDDDESGDGESLGE